MDSKAKSTIRRFSFNKRKQSVEPELKPALHSVLEESKRLEYLNRQITKSTCRNIVKHISDYRKSSSPVSKNLGKNDSDMIHAYEHLLKKPLGDIKSNFLLTPLEKSVERCTVKSQEKPKKMPSEFAEIDFKDTMWPEESVLDDNLFDIISTNDFKRPIFRETLIERKPRIRNIRIKSRIGEIGRKFAKTNRKSSLDNAKKTNTRVFTPWTYTGNGYSCITSPFI